jgi:hypothetical protein
MKLQFKELPVNASFWRENDPIMWQKSDNRFVFHHTTPTELIIDPEFLEEIVLVHPLICSNCLKDVGGFPPPKKCPHCGDISMDRDSLESMKKIIRDWTGNQDPHI